MPIKTALLILLAIQCTACATPWRERASSAALGCPAAEIVISEPTSGTFTNTWKAQCKGTLYACSVAADAETDATPTCREDGSGASVKVVPAPPRAAESRRTPPATTAAQTELESKLATLKRAHEQGLLTDAEYQAKKKALLDAF